MKKDIFFDQRAIKELNKFNNNVKLEFQTHITVLRKYGKLDYPEAKKVSNNLFEMRVRVGGIYRGFYAYFKGDLIIILHFFQKKSQKTPIKNLKTAQDRFKEYE